MPITKILIIAAIVAVVTFVLFFVDKYRIRTIRLARDDGPKESKYYKFHGARSSTLSYNEYNSSLTYTPGNPAYREEICDVYHLITTPSYTLRLGVNTLENSHPGKYGTIKYNKKGRHVFQPLKDQRAAKKEFEEKTKKATAIKNSFIVRLLKVFPLFFLCSNLLMLVCRSSDYIVTVYGDAINNLPLTGFYFTLPLGLLTFVCFFAPIVLMPLVTWKVIDKEKYGTIQKLINIAISISVCYGIGNLIDKFFADKPGEFNFPIVFFETLSNFNFGIATAIILVGLIIAGIIVLFKKAGELFNKTYNKFF